MITTASRINRTALGWAAAVLIAATGVVLPLRASGDDGERLLRIDHFVRVTSAVPSMTGQPAQIYVREVVKAGTALRASSLADRVVLFIHGAGTPADLRI